MLRHRNIDRICCVILALTLLVTVLFTGAAASGLIEGETSVGYENRLFDQSRVHTIDIVMQDWESFLQTCTSEEYAACHLVIDGEEYKNAAIRGKGNTSLSSVAAYGNNRYSFKVEFDHYQTGMTYHGLDKLSLNNLIQDNTYMKDYFAYTLMNKMGVAAPLCSFVQITVNGELWGLYLAVEGVEDAFLQRNYGRDYGELYKPDSMSFGGGRGNGRDFDMNEMAEQFGFRFGEERQEDSGETDDSDSSENSGNMPTVPDMGEMTGGFDPSTMFGGGMPNMGSMPDMGEMTEGFDPSTMFGGGMPDMGAMPDMGEMTGGFDPSTMFGGGMPNMGSMPDMGEMTEGFDPSTMFGGGMPNMGSMPDMTGEESGRPAMDFGGFGGFGSSTDVKLQYNGDDPSGYSNIFNNAKTDITQADQKRLIASLKALGEGDVSVVDTEAVIRYMAVHNFLCNGDSYTGMMVHNYYLYEEDGVLSMIPWDYNLAYGGFNGGSAESAVNTDISRLVSSGADSDRPMAGWITASDEYMAQYLAVYQEFMTEVFDSGWFAGEIDRVTAMIDPYVKEEPSAFCTYEEFKTASETLRSFCLKRAESVSNQLAGDSTRVDASGLDLSVMGTMNGMGGGRGREFGMQGGGRGDFMNFGDRKNVPSGMREGNKMSAGGIQPFGGREDADRAAVSGDGEAPAGEDADGSRQERVSFGNGWDAEGMRQADSPKAWAQIGLCAVLLAAALLLAGAFRSNR